MAISPTVAAHVRPRAPAPAFAPVLVDAARCKGCGLCVAACPARALAIEPAAVNAMGHHPAVLVDPAACTSCVRCARMCPEAALTVLARPREARP